MSRLRDTGIVYWHSQGMHHVPAHGDWLDEILATRLARLPYTKRREEARLGRWTAKATIAAAAELEPAPQALRKIVVANAPDGAPEATLHGAPLDAVIAMTDRADWAVCALMAGSTRIGCDLELVEPRSPEFVHDYLTPAEQRRVNGAQDRDLAANLIWSAKESALKILRTGLRRDTRSVEVSYEDGVPGTWSPLAVRDTEGRQYSGWWLRHGHFLLTVAAASRVPPPRSLVDPPPLRDAEPGHSWLDNPYSDPGAGH